MDKKQDIGAAFKQRLEALDQGPNDSSSIWDGIAAQLDAEKTDPTGIPFWLKSGVVVLLVGLTSLGIWQFTADSTPAESPIEITDNTELPPANTKNEQNDSQDQNSSGTPKAQNQQAVPAIADADTDADNDSEATNGNATTQPTSDAVVSRSNRQSPESNYTENGINTQAVTNNSNPLTTTADNSNPLKNTADQIENASAIIVASNDDSIKNTTNSVPTKTLNVNQNAVTNLTQATDNSVTRASLPQTGDNKTKGNNTQVSTVENQQGSKTKAVANSNTDTSLPARGYYVWPKKSFNEQGIDQSTYPLVYKIEASANASALPVIAYRSGKTKKSKEARILERSLRREEVTTYKWSVGAVLAPTSYGSLTKGSMLDARLEDNPRDGESNLSYGLQVKNKMSRKSALRFGVNRVNVGYNTENFQVNIIDNVVNIYQLTGIDPGAEIQQGGISLDPRATEFFEANDVVTIDQDISYFEVPVEYVYSLFDSRFDANLIGGASLMVLDDNRIFAVSESGESVAVGKSSNLTNLGYTLNLGIGLKYDISKHFQLNVDPMLKVQMNSPENTSTNNFRPYYFGIFSGINFKF